MKIVCKCGNALTKNLQKVHHKDAYNCVSLTEKLVGFEEGDTETEWEDKEFSVKEGTYHRWDRKHSFWGKFKNVYTVSDKDFTGAEVFDESKGCCRFDYYGLKCSQCGEEVGYGNNDCWQDDAAFLYTVKTKVVQ